MLTSLKYGHTSLEALTLNLLSNLITLVGLGLRDTLNVEHLFLSAESVKSCIRQIEFEIKKSFYLPHEDR